MVILSIGLNVTVGKNMRYMLQILLKDVRQVVVVLKSLMVNRKYEKY